MNILSQLFPEKYASAAPAGQAGQPAATQNMSPAGGPVGGAMTPNGNSGTVTVAHQASPKIGEMGAPSPFSMTHPLYPGGANVGSQPPQQDPNMQAAAPPPPPPEPIEPVAHVPALSDPAGFFKGMDQRLSKMLSKYSAASDPWAAFDSPLDPSSATGRSGGFPASPVPNPIDSAKHPNLSKFYDMGRKMLLGPMLNVGKKPMGALTDSYSTAAQPYHSELARIDALAPPKTPGAALLANFAGSLIGGNNPSAEAWQGAAGAAAPFVPSMLGQ